jgi:hypothetical protein
MPGAHKKIQRTQTTAPPIKPLASKKEEHENYTSTNHFSIRNIVFFVVFSWRDKNKIGSL